MLTGEGAPPIIDQIRDALQANLARVIDLFREWDGDSSGSVSKVEFRKALSVLGLEIPREDADALFDSFDADGGGTVEFSELSKKLKPRVKVNPLPKVRSLPRLTAPANTTDASTGGFITVRACLRNESEGSALVSRSAALSLVHTYVTVTTPAASSSRTLKKRRSI